MPLPLPRKPQSPIYQLQLQLQASTRVDIRRKHSRPLTHPLTHPPFHRGFNRGNVCASSAPTAGQPARFDPFNLNGAKLAADRSIPLPACLPACPPPPYSPIETRKSANHPRGEACHEGVRTARDVSPRSGRLIKRARVYASHNHHHHLPPPPSARAWGGKKINKIPSLRATAFIGHPISTTYFATSTFPPPLLPPRSATLLGRPTCSFHPHQPRLATGRGAEASVPVSGFAGAPPGGGGARGREIERERTRALLSDRERNNRGAAPRPPPPRPPASLLRASRGSRQPVS